MVFNEILGIGKIEESRVKMFHREAVRGIVVRDNNILLVHTKKGDYKFPGGGVKKEEDHEVALLREITEETGYIAKAIKEKIGVIIERRPDEFEENAVFEMISHYYLCVLSQEQGVQQLDEYEAELDFRPVWIEIKKAIEVNEEILKSDRDKNAWVEKRDEGIKGPTRI